MGQALAQMQEQMRANHKEVIVEDSVDSLIRKLEGQGKKVKII
jgi:hypothetical protein